MSNRPKWCLATHLLYRRSLIKHAQCPHRPLRKERSALRKGLSSSGIQRTLLIHARAAVGARQKCTRLHEDKAGTKGCWCRHSPRLRWLLRPLYACQTDLNAVGAWTQTSDEDWKKTLLFWPGYPKWSIWRSNTTWLRSRTLRWFDVVNVRTLSILRKSRRKATTW